MARIRVTTGTPPTTATGLETGFAITATYPDKPKHLYEAAGDGGDLMRAEPSKPVEHARGTLAGAQLLPREVCTLMLDAGWSSAEALVTGIAVCSAESLRFTKAVGGPWANDTRDFGLWQLNEIHAGPLGLTVAEFERRAYDPVWATRFARSLFRAAGYTWSPWAAHTNGSYRRFNRIAVAGLANAQAERLGLTPVPLVRFA